MTWFGYRTSDNRSTLDNYYNNASNYIFNTNNTFAANYYRLGDLYDKYTRMWAMKCKKHEELEKINFFKTFMGIIIKDGTDLYNGFGIGHSQCISHIQRYLKGIYDFVNHKGPREMAEFFKIPHVEKATV